MWIAVRALLKFVGVMALGSAVTVGGLAYVASKEGSFTESEEEKAETLRPVGEQPVSTEPQTQPAAKAEIKKIMPELPPVKFFDESSEDFAPQKAKTPAQAAPEIDRESLLDQHVRNYAEDFEALKQTDPNDQVKSETLKREKTKSFTVITSIALPSPATKPDAEVLKKIEEKKKTENPEAVDEIQGRLNTILSTQLKQRGPDPKSEQ